MVDGLVRWIANRMHSSVSKSGIEDLVSLGLLSMLVGMA